MAYAWPRRPIIMAYAETPRSPARPADQRLEPAVPLRPTDRLSLWYAGITIAIILIGHARVAHWGLLVAALLGYAMAIMAFAAYATRRPGNRWVRGLWLLYPVLLAPVLYDLVGQYATVWRGRYVDAAMISLEAR